MQKGQREALARFPLRATLLCLAMENGSFWGKGLPARPPAWLSVGLHPQSSNMGNFGCEWAWLLLAAACLVLQPIQELLVATPVDGAFLYRGTWDGSVGGDLLERGGILEDGLITRELLYPVLHEMRCQLSR